MKKIQIVITGSDGTETTTTTEGASITEPMVHAAEDLLHTISTGERQIVKNFYEVCAKAFGTTREAAKERLIAAAYGMDPKTFRIRASALRCETMSAAEVLAALLIAACRSSEEEHPLDLMGALGDVEIDSYALQRQLAAHIGCEDEDRAYHAGRFAARFGA